MKKIFALIAFGSLLASACTMLDYNEYSGYDKKDVYTSFDRVKASLTNIYAYIPSAYGTIDNAMRAAACDEAVFVNQLSGIHNMNNGGWSPSKTYDTFYNYYTGIRQVKHIVRVLRVKHQGILVAFVDCFFQLVNNASGIFLALLGL